jgi:hypothetical protein
MAPPGYLSLCFGTGIAGGVPELKLLIINESPVSRRQKNIKIDSQSIR